MSRVHRDPHSMSYLCLILIGVWNNFQGAERLVKIPLDVHAYASVFMLIRFKKKDFSALKDAGKKYCRVMEFTLCGKGLVDMK